MEIFLIIFFAAAGLQILYFLFFLIAFSSAGKRQEQNMSEPASIIVCAHDEEQNLRELIPLLTSQDYPEYEVIIIDDRSNDDTWPLLREEAINNSRLKVVSVDKTPEKFNAKKYALTLGIKAAKYEKLILTDADCRPSGTKWLSRMMASFGEGTQIVLGYSPYYAKKGLLNRFIRFESLMTAIQYIGYALLRIPYMGVGRNLAYTRSLFLNNKGFHDFLHVTGGDDDLFINRYATARNTKVCLGADALVYSIPKTRWRSFFRQKVRHLSVGKLYKPGHRIMLGLFTISYFVTWFSGLPLLFLYDPYYWVAAPLALRSLLMFVLIYVAGRKMGDKFSLWPVVFLDFIYSIYYISTGLAALLTKKVQWRS